MEKYLKDHPYIEPNGLQENREGEIMFHSTSPENVDNILSQGLKVGQESRHTQAGDWADEHYGTRPVYLSLEKKYEGQPLMIDTSGLKLVADLPSLVDAGANVEEEVMWWNEGEEPPELEPHLEQGEVQIFDLLNDPEVIEAAIKTTGTAASLENISSDRITSEPLQEKWSKSERRKRAKKCDNPKGFSMKQFCDNLNEEEPFQKAVKKKHKKMKIRLIGLGGGKNTRGTKKPSYKRSKSAPPGFGGSLEENK